MNYTTNLNLKKPEGTDFYDVGDFNENADIIDAVLAALALNFAPVYSASQTYSAGALALHENKLYKCTTDISIEEEWTAAHWTAVSLKDIMSGSGFITVETDPTVPSWAKQPSKPGYTYSEVGAAAAGHDHSNATSSVPGFMSAADKAALDGHVHAYQTVTIEVSDWSNKACTKTVQGITSSNKFIVDAGGNKISVTAQGTNSISFSCEKVPDASVTLKVFIFS